MRFLITLALMPALAGCSASYADHGGAVPAATDDRLERALAGRVAGPPQQCLPINRATQSTVHRGAILYRSGNTVYRNDLNGCPELNFNTVPVIKVRGSTVCAGEIVQLADRGIGGPVGACSFGPFVPYTRVR